MRPDADDWIELRQLFDRMYQNTRIFERLLIQAEVGLDSDDLGLWLNTLQHLRAVTDAQTRKLTGIEDRLLERRLKDRRSGLERRAGAA